MAQLFGNRIPHNAMHLHQELEGYYLGTAPNTAIDAPTVVIAAKTAKRSRASTSKKKLLMDDKPKTILLILEDFDEIRAFLVRQFDRSGYEVYSSATLRDALVIAMEETPRVILIDYDLKGETHGELRGRCSIQAIQRLHEVLPEIYIVLIGGPQMKEVTEQAIFAGASKVLSKSYAISEMDYIVSSASRIGDRAIIE
jgi:ActR/RegA family two-component response regulator